MAPCNKRILGIAQFILCILLGNVRQASAQTPLDKLERIIPADPEAANLGRYGNYNLNLSTGQIDISVPLHDIKGVILNYPISISYDHKGIRVKERATSAGMNWNFNAASVITRTVNGLPDDRPSLGYNANYTKVALAQSVPSIYNPTSMLSDPLYSATTGAIDLLPDEFSFSFNGRSGKFFFDPADGKYYTMPYSKLVITRSSSPESFEITDEGGFRYIFGQYSNLDYFFTTSGGGNESNGSYKSQWYLTKILGPDGTQELEFSYINDLYLNQVNETSESQTFLLEANAVGSCPGNVGNGPVSQGISTTYNNINYNSLLLSEIKSPLERLLIKYKSRTDQSLAIDSVLIQRNAVGNFETKHAWKFYQGYYPVAGKLRLDSLAHFAAGERVSAYTMNYSSGTVPNKDSRGIDHWGFYNGTNNISLLPTTWYESVYVGSANREPSSSAANGILKTITYPTGGSTEFEFELNEYGSAYNPSGAIAQPVSQPIFTPTSKSVVRRTVSNGAGTSTASFTLDTTTVVRFDTRRDNCDGQPPNGGSNCTIEPCMTTILLTRPNGTNINISGPVVNPQTKYFELSPGTYTVSVQTSEALDYGNVLITYNRLTGYNKKPYAGGLRIKRIKNYDAVGGVNVKRFSYISETDPDKSSGIIQSLPRYTHTTVTWADCGGGSLPACGQRRLNLNLSSSSITPITFADGSSVSYSRVVEYIGENGEGGYVDHRFSTKGDETVLIYPFASATSNSWKRGLPVQTLYFTKDGRLIREELQEYTFEPTTNFHQIVGAKGGFSSFCPSSVVATNINFGFTAYNSQWFYLSNEIFKTYPDNNIPDDVAEEKSYIYSSASLLPTRIKKTESDGSVTELRKKYPQDYIISSGSSDPVAKALELMIQKNMLSYTVEETQVLLRGGSERAISGSLNTYKEFSTGRIYPWKSFVLEPESGTTGTGLSYVNNNVFGYDNHFTKKVEYTAYNNLGKIAEALDQTEMPYAIFYDLNGILPISYAKNARLNQIYFNGFEEIAPNSTASQVKYGKYANNGALTVPGSALLSGKYLIGWWRYNGSDWEYRTQTILHNGISNISVGDGSIMDELSIRPPNSMLNSFSYDPGTGLTSKVEDNGYGKKFDFDLLGRLTMARDHNNNIFKRYIYKSQGAQ